MNQETHLHFIIWAYENYDIRLDKYTGVVELDLIDSSVELARARARNMFPSLRIIVRRVVEHPDSFPCSAEIQEIQNAQGKTAYVSGREIYHELDAW